MVPMSCFEKKTKTKQKDLNKNELHSNEMSRNESSFLQYLPLFWPVWQ